MSSCDSSFLKNPIALNLFFLKFLRIAGKPKKILTYLKLPSNLKSSTSRSNSSGTRSFVFGSSDRLSNTTGHAPHPIRSRWPGGAQPTEVHGQKDNPRSMKHVVFLEKPSERFTYAPQLPIITIITDSGVPRNPYKRSGTWCRCAFTR